MSDLISREAILDMLDDINNHINEGCKYRHDWCVEWVKGLPSIDAVPMEKWQELKETVLELRDNGGTATQKEVSDFLFNLMRILEGERKEP